MTVSLTRGVAAAVAAVTLALTTGCGGSKSDVSGKVTYGGKTVTSGTVTLIASDKKPYYGTIGPDGTYTVSGVPTGTVKILVSSPNPDAANRKNKIKGGDGDLAAPAPGSAPAAAVGWFPIPDKYGDQAATDLTGEVTGSTTVLNIDMK